MANFLRSLLLTFCQRSQKQTHEFVRRVTCKETVVQETNTSQFIAAISTFMYNISQQYPVILAT